MEPRFENMPEICCVGVQYFGDNKAGEIPAMWPIFNELSDQVKNKTTPPIYMGVEVYTSAFHAQRKWFYLAGMQVADLNHIPIGLVGKVIPPNRYAIFEHKGKLPGKIGETFGFIYGQWLPKSGFKQAGPYDFERYDARFKGPDDDESVMEICIPIL